MGGGYKKYDTVMINGRNRIRFVKANSKSKNPILYIKSDKEYITYKSFLRKRKVRGGGEENINNGDTVILQADKGLGTPNIVEKFREPKKIIIDRGEIKISDSDTKEALKFTILFVDDSEHFILKRIYKEEYLTHTTDNFLSSDILTLTDDKNKATLFKRKQIEELITRINREERNIVGNTSDDNPYFHNFAKLIRTTANSIFFKFKINRV